MANIHFCKNHNRAFVASSHCFPDIIYNMNIQKCCDLENIVQGHDVQHSQWQHLIANTQTHTHTASDMVIMTGKICKANLPKNL